MAKLRNLISGDLRDPREKLRELFEASDDREAEQRAVQWARGVAEAESLSAEDELRVIAALRTANPRLSLKPATFLAARLKRA